MSEAPAASHWHEIRRFWSGLNTRYKLAAALGTLLGVAAIVLPPDVSPFAEGPAVLVSVAFGQWAVVLAGPARLLIADAPPGEPDATAPELARGRAPVIVALACALPGWLALCWHAGLAVGLVVFGVLLLEIVVLRLLRRAVRR